MPSFMQLFSLSSFLLEEIRYAVLFELLWLITLGCFWFILPVKCLHDAVMHTVILSCYRFVLTKDNVCQFAMLMWLVCLCLKECFECCWQSLRPSAHLFSQLSKVLKLNSVQEIAFGLAAFSSSNSETHRYAVQFVRHKLPQLLNSYIDTGLHNKFT